MYIPSSKVPPSFKAHTPFPYPHPTLHTTFFHVSLCLFLFFPFLYFFLHASLSLSLSHSPLPLFLSLHIPLSSCPPWPHTSRPSPYFLNSSIILPPRHQSQSLPLNVLYFSSMCLFFSLTHRVLNSTSLPNGININ